ncbi:uncharacterized protein LOC62_07G008966 [Vanrija pseudolonga]|uniref:Uncharacterized protein n=1 Tax=Vanrija pseudolonga TaxID=143232 RepID=A0AAF1BLU1_9TREE|nr:hypothetical protein LOC62_07G008966 [Vanrija pseudolonga]
MRLSRALVRRMEPSLYTHVWLEPWSSRADHAAVFFFPDSERVRIPGLALHACRGHAYGPIPGRSVAHPVRVGCAIAGCLARAVLRRLDTRTIGPAHHALSRWRPHTSGPPPTVEEVLRLRNPPRLDIPTEVSFYHLSSLAHDAMAGPPGGSSVRSMSAGWCLAVSVFYLDPACSRHRNVPIPYTVTAAATQLVLFLPSTRGPWKTCPVAAKPAYDCPLGVLNRIVTSLAATSSTQVAKKVCIGPMEHLDNDMLNLSHLDDDVTLDKRNDVIRAMIHSMLPSEPWAYMFVQRITFLNLREMKATVGHEVWDWVTVSPGALLTD